MKVSKEVKEILAAITAMAEEKGIDPQLLAEKIGAAIVTSNKKATGGFDITNAAVDIASNTFRIYTSRTVVMTPENEYTEIAKEEAKKIKKDVHVGDIIETDLDTKNISRIIAQSAKNVIHQAIREAEHGKILEEFQSKSRDVVTAIIQRIDPKTGNATITINGSTAVLPKQEQIPDEVFEEGDHVKVYVVDVRSTEKGPRIMLSRTHPGLVTRLFEAEVPEIFDGVIEIKSVSRQAGSRTKLAVFTENDEIDAIGACIGQRGMRVNNIVEELRGEKIDIVKYSEDPIAFVSEALSPAKVVKVEILDETEKSCRATVPDSQLSLAIGNKGQNVRLAAKLTGWKIDIRPESGFFGEEM